MSKETTETQKPPLLLQAITTLLLLTTFVLLLALLYNYSDTYGKIVFALLLLAPLIRTASSIVMGEFAWSINNLIYGYTAVFIGMILLLGIQLSAAPLILLTGPFWFLMILMDSAEVLAYLFSSQHEQYRPLFCSMFDIPSGLCIPSQIGYHLLNAGILLSVMKYGSHFLDEIVDKGGLLIEHFSDKIEHPQSKERVE